MSLKLKRERVTTSGKIKPKLDVPDAAALDATADDATADEAEAEGGSSTLQRRSKRRRCQTASSIKVTDLDKRQTEAPP